MCDPGLARLQRIVAALRGPDGCPWDREQTLATLEHYLLEETYELLEAMRGGPDHHREELGDVLFQVVFQAQLRAEEGAFELADVVAGIADKLERRHPHVFGDERVADREAVARRWEELKRAEGKGGVEDVPRTLPALMRAAAVGAKAAGCGFDWPDVEGPMAKVFEELGELREEIEAPPSEARQARLHAELGDLLFAAVNVARHLGVRPEVALSDATDRFADRYGRVAAALAAQGRALSGATAEELDALWERAKAAADG